MSLTKTLERRLLTGPVKTLTLTNRKRRRAQRDDDKPDEKPAADSNGGEGKEGDKPAADEGGKEGKKEEGKEDDQGDDEGRDGDGPGTITGYAAVAYSAEDPGTEYELWSDRSFRAVERVAAGCFKRALADGDDVRGLYNHEPDALLGRTSAGTMRLEEDERGLRYEIDLPDTQAGRDVAELVDRGDLTGSSFGFVVEQESWRESDDGDGTLAVRTIESVRLLDCGPVTYPAYSATSAGRSADGTVRAIGSVEEARASYQRWRESQVPLAAKLAAIRARAAAAMAAT